MNITLSISDWISLAGILTSLLISTATLIYNAKITRDSLKPDIQVYLDYLASDSLQYLVIKNFGKTGATLKNITHNLTNDFFVSLKLDNPNRIYLAPNQLIYFVFSSADVKNKYKLNEIIFKFDYKYGIRKIKAKRIVSLCPSSLSEKSNLSKDEILRKIDINLSKTLLK